MVIFVINERQVKAVILYISLFTDTQVSTGQGIL